MGRKILKAEFHLHTSDDPRDMILYTAEEVIDRAARRGYGVLAITNHDAMSVTDAIMAAARGGVGSRLGPRRLLHPGGTCCEWRL